MQHAFRIDPSLVLSCTVLRTPGHTYPIRSTCCQGLTPDQPMERAGLLSIH